MTDCADSAYMRASMSSLKTNLNSLATTFADAVLSAIRSAPLEELLSESTRGPRRRREPGEVRGEPRAAATAASGRLKRRSAGDIATALDHVVTLVKKHKSGLRAEQIRHELHMQAKEMPRVLKEGLSRKKLKAKGQKRATTYFAA